MPRLRLSFIMQTERPQASTARDPMTFQVWRGGACVGGTLDLALRGRNEGEPQWCAISDYQPDGAAPGTGKELEQISPGERLSPENAGALFIVTMDVAPEAEEEFNDWYNLEHIPRLTQVPGVICARRFRALGAGSRYAAIYHLADASAYASAPWCEADRTPWISRMRRFQRDRHYFMFKPA